MVVGVGVAVGSAVGSFGVSPESTVVLSLSVIVDIVDGNELVELRVVVVVVVVVTGVGMLFSKAPGGVMFVCLFVPLVLK